MYHYWSHVKYTSYHLISLFTLAFIVTTSKKMSLKLLFLPIYFRLRGNKKERQSERLKSKGKDDREVTRFLREHEVQRSRTSCKGARGRECKRGRDKEREEREGEREIGREIYTDRKRERKKERRHRESERDGEREAREMAGRNGQRGNI